jgi:antitoxin component YwqK of YwqJK toxin-antitoxin module
MRLPALILVATAGTAASFGIFRSASGAETIHSQTTYFANGQVDTECSVRDGQRDGTCRRFYADGTKQSEGSYSAGKMEGEWTFWRRDGSLDTERSGTYAGGTKVGS